MRLYQSLIALLLLGVACVAGTLNVGDRIFIGQKIPRPPLFRYFQDSSGTVNSALARHDYDGFLGCNVVAASNCTIYALGRWESNTNQQDHPMAIYFTPYMPLVGSGVTTNMLLCTLVGQATVKTKAVSSNQMVYGFLTTPVHVNAGQCFCVVSMEFPNGDWWRDQRGYTESPHFTNRQASAFGPPYNVVGTGFNATGSMYVPVDFLYTLDGNNEPDLITGYTVDYNVASLSYTNGYIVTNLPETGINRWNARAADGASAPFWTNNPADINGKPYLSFNGSTTRMQTNIVTTFTQPTTVFVVSRNRTFVKPSPYIYDGGVAGAGRMALYYYAAGSAWASWSGNNVSFAGPNYGLGQWSLIETHYNGASTTVFTNGVLAGASDSGANPWGGITIGSDFTGGGTSFWTGDLARLTVFNTDVTGTALVRLQEYYRTNYNLPVNPPIP